MNSLNLNVKILNFDSPMLKAICAFYICKKTFEKRWGQKSFIRCTLPPLVLSLPMEFFYDVRWKKRTSIFWTEYKNNRSREGDEKTEKCAVIGSYLDDTMTCNDFQCLLVAVANKIYYNKMVHCRISRILWPYRSLERTQTLPFDKVSIRFLAVVITGHCMVDVCSNVWVILKITSRLVPLRNII